MNRRVLIGSTLASAILSLGLVGCDGGGVEEGVPKEIPKTAVVPVEDFKPDMAGQSAKVRAESPNAKNLPPMPAEKKK